MKYTLIFAAAFFALISCKKKSPDDMAKVTVNEDSSFTVTLNSKLGRVSFLSATFKKSGGLKSYSIIKADTLIRLTYASNFLPHYVEVVSVKSQGRGHRYYYDSSDYIKLGGPIKSIDAPFDSVKVRFFRGGRMKNITWMTNGRFDSSYTFDSLVKNKIVRDRAGLQMNRTN